MDSEQPLKPQQKVNIPEDEKETIEVELRYIEQVLKAVEDGDENTAYADTQEAMATIGNMLKDNPDYQSTLAERREASRKCMQGDESEKREGLKQARAWVEKVRGLL